MHTHGHNKASAPPLSRTWAAYQRGYRREGDAVWVATKVSNCPLLSQSFDMVSESKQKRF